MARARNVKPGLFKNEILGVADPLYTLLFEGLWLLADREGRLENRPMRIKGELFPYRDGLDMASMLSWLEEQGFILRYSSNGLALIQIIAFTKHQNPHKNESPSEYPGPCTEEIGTTTEEIGSTRADSLSTDSLSTDSGLLESPPQAASPPPPPKPKKSKPVPAELPEGFAISARVREWAVGKGYGQLDSHLEAFVAKCRAKGYAYASWDDAFMGAIREDWAKLRGKTANGVAPPAEVRHHDSAEQTSRMLAERNRGTTTMPPEIRQLAAQLTGRKTA